MNPLCIYHAGCLDGQGAATAFFRKYRDAEFHPGIYSEAPPNVAGRDVYLVDFSYPLEVLKEMLVTASHVTIIDHHDTAIRELQDFDHPKLTKFMSNDNSGAVLTWLYLNPGLPPPEMLMLIEDRDLWRQPPRFEHTKAVTAYLYSLNFDPITWVMFLDQRRWVANLSIMRTAGEALLRSDAKRVQALLENVTTVNIAGFDVPAVNANHFHASDLGNEMAKGRAFSVSYYDTPQHRVYSLRSEKNGALSQHVGDIAKQFGGGGHRNAAGFRLSHPERASGNV